MKIKEETNSRNFLAFKDNSSEVILNGLKTQEAAKTFISKNYIFVYFSYLYTHMWFVYQMFADNYYTYNVCKLIFIPTVIYL